ncbi:MAG TPA: hypothetical protein VIT22_13010 [Pseudoxanthomonas sp.]
MNEGIARRIGIEAIRYVASTQAMGMVVFHGAWMLLALATWKHAAGGESGMGSIAHGLLRAYRWLGGVDPDGHGDAGNLMAVFGKLSLVVYAVSALFRRLFGAWPPAPLWLVATISGLVALFGYLLAIWPSLVANGKAGDTAFVVGTFTVLATLSTLWAVLARRGGEWLIARMNLQPAVRDATVGDALQRKSA